MSNIQLTNDVKIDVNSIQAIDLLWENSSPTSAFSGQTINLDLSDYDFVLIGYNGTGYQNTLSDNGRNYIICSKSGKEAIMKSSSTSNVWGIRQVNVQASSIVFGSGYYVWAMSSSAGSEARNTASVPKEIYGIKLNTVNLTS